MQLSDVNGRWCWEVEEGPNSRLLRFRDIERDFLLYCFHVDTTLLQARSWIKNLTVKLNCDLKDCFFYCCNTDCIVGDNLLKVQRRIFFFYSLTQRDA